MTVLRKRLLRRVLGLFLLAVIGLNALAWIQVRAMLRYADGGTGTRKPEALSPLQKALVLFTGTRVPRPHGAETPADYGLPFERLTLSVPGGVRLGAWFCPAPATGSVVVLLFHGYAQDKTSLLPEAAALQAVGLSTLLVDFRGSGDSSASHATIGFEEGEDVAAAFRYARTRFPRTTLVLYGHSMGAAAILRAVAAHADVRPDGIVLEAVFDTLLHTVENRFHAMKIPSFPNAQLLVLWGGVQFGFNGFTLNPVDYARAVDCPTLFFHGTGDPRATRREAERVRDAIPHRSATFVTFPSSTHDDIAFHHRALWQRNLDTFIQNLPPTHD